MVLAWTCFFVRSQGRITFKMTLASGTAPEMAKKRKRYPPWHSRPLMLSCQYEPGRIRNDYGTFVRAVSIP